MQVVVKLCAWAIGRRASRTRETGYGLASADGDSEAHELDPIDDGLGPAEAVERDESVSERFALLDRLKPNERRALLLLGMGYSYR
jgi:DNA-directed RNA polymerase specialized sigma24 family protein